MPGGEHEPQLRRAAHHKQLQLAQRLSVVIDDLAEYGPGSKHSTYLRSVCAYTERHAGRGELPLHKLGDLDAGGSEDAERHAAGHGQPAKITPIG
jgi:hypothetical protein